MSYESERMKVIENILDEVKKHKNDNGEVECYPSYDQEALKLVDDGHVDWLYERVQELERANKQLKNNLSVYKNYYNNTLKHNKKLIEQVQELEETNKKNYWIAADFKFENLKLEQQNKRYREVIQEVKKSLITARKSYSNNKVNQQVYESLKTIQELEESE